jgi:AraC-like DNA-binding protein
LIAGGQAGISLAVGVAIGISRLPVPVRACGVLAALAYGLNCLANSHAGGLIEQISLLWVVVCTFSATAGGLVWVMVVALFDDKPVKPLLFTPAVTVALATLMLVTTDHAVAAVFWWTANLLGLLVFLHALFLLARGRAGDLVESRRRLRRPVVWACIGMGASQLAVFLLAQGRVQDWAARAFAFGEVLALAALAGALFELRRTIFESPPIRAPRDTLDESLVAALGDVMGKQEAWREESLSIGDLAARLSIPEHRLRKLINGRLGYRNFSSFINGYRIEAAKRRLTDPREKDRTVAQIAFDLGFTSLSPFNRAFKEATGRTPTAWRRGPTADGN